MGPGGAARWQARHAPGSALERGRSVGDYLAETIVGLLIVGVLAAVVVWFIN
jgi:hypothetical protein